MIHNVLDFIRTVESDLEKWPSNIRPWFRGESGTECLPLTPKIQKYTATQENYLLQSFRRKAGGLANTPPRSLHADLWLFLAQHYGMDTRLLDWTEGALIALFFAVNRENPKPCVYMLNTYKLNSLAYKIYWEKHGKEKKNCPEPPDFPLTWPYANWLNYDIKTNCRITAYENIALAWEFRNEEYGFDLPIAVPATYQDQRMIAQRSCFTIHGKRLDSLITILQEYSEKPSDYIKVYKFSNKDCKQITNQLSYLGISQSTIFPNLDSLTIDIMKEIKSQ